MPNTISRRGLLGGLAALLGAGLGGGTLLSTASGPAVALAGSPTSFEATDAPTVERNDGRVAAVYLRPELDVRWRDFGSGVASVSLEVAVAGDAGVDSVYDVTLETVAERPGAVTEVDPAADAGFDAVEGGLTVGFERADITAHGDDVTSERLSDGSLAAGEQAVTTLELLLRADVVGNEGEAETVVETTTFDVTVRNPDGDADAGGEVDTDAE